MTEKLLSLYAFLFEEIHSFYSLKMNCVLFKHIQLNVINDYILEEIIKFCFMRERKLFRNRT